MKFETTSISVEVNNILANGAKKVHGYYYCNFYIKGKIYQSLKITNIDIYKDYLNNYCDEILIDVKLSSGTYENEFVPNKENIEVKIFHKPISENSLNEDLTQDIALIEGRAVLTDKENQFFSNPTSALDRETRDKMSIQTVTFQVVNPILEAFRMQSTGGIFRLTTGADLIKTMLLNVTNVNDVDVTYKVKGVDVAPGFNAEVKNHINIPQGTKLLDVPDYINKNVEGIYPAGLGFYLQKDIWYLYPVYDVEQFNKSNRTLTILRVPSDVLPVTDRSFVTSKNNVTIIANKSTTLTDDSDIAQLNQGNGLRFTDAKAIMEDFVAIDGNKATASRGKNVNEFIMDKRDTQLNNVVSPTAKISSNPYYEMSKIASRNGSMIDVLWEYSDSTLLHPGMPVRFMTQQGDGISITYGVLLAAHEMIMLEGQGMAASKHKRACNLSVFIKRKIKWNEEKSNSTTV